jgi:hypothetical protein
MSRSAKLRDAFVQQMLGRLCLGVLEERDVLYPRDASRSVGRAVAL